jgi:L-iditol 2-dehydrogenase
MAKRLRPPFNEGNPGGVAAAGNPGGCRHPPASHAPLRCAPRRAAMPSGSNIGAVLHAVGDLRVEALDMPSPGPGQVLLRVQSTGICGSDNHYYRHGRIGDFVCRASMVLGHEASAIVAAVGVGVSSLAAGDRVAIEPGVPCSSCGVCLGGRYNLCPDMRFAATPPVHGSLARFVVHPAQFCFRMPDSMSFDVGALLEPLSVGIHATRRAGVALGHTVLVTGCGTVGLLSIVAARAAGASRVVATDVDKGRLAVAATFGAETVAVSDGTDAKALGGTLQVDSCIECSGAEASVRLCLLACKPGGRVVRAACAALPPVAVSHAAAV